MVMDSCLLILVNGLNIVSGIFCLESSGLEPIGDFLVNLAVISGIDSHSVPEETDSHKLEPDYVTGFADAEACFSITINKNPKSKTGWQVRAKFEIELHQKDRDLLERIKASFGVGNIYKSGKNKIKIKYQASSLKNLALDNSPRGFWTFFLYNKKKQVDWGCSAAVIIRYFDKHPLITQKRAQLFKAPARASSL
jgi:hypothetical protein